MCSQPVASNLTNAAASAQIPGLAGTVVEQVADVEANRSNSKVTVNNVTVAHDCRTLSTRTTWQAPARRRRSRLLQRIVWHPPRGARKDRSGCVRLPCPCHC